MLAFLAFGGIFFWAVVLILLAFTWSNSVKDNWGWGIFLMAVILIGGEWWASTSDQTWALAWWFQDWIHFLGGVLVYFVLIGAPYSYYKFRRVAKGIGKILIDFKLEKKIQPGQKLSAEQWSEFQDRVYEKYEVNVYRSNENKLRIRGIVDRVITALVFWPFVFIWEFIFEWVYDAWMKFANWAVSVYNRILDQFGEVDVDFGDLRK